MKKIVHKPAAPLYAAAAAWVLYALLFPLYRPGHFVIALAASAVVYGIARLFCKDIVEEVPQEPETTGNPGLDQMVSEGQGALDEMRRLNDMSTYDLPENSRPAEVWELEPYGLNNVNTRFKVVETNGK